MSNPTKISYLAVASLVFGMVFYVPLVTGILAIVTGIFAIKAIKKYEGILLGKGMAISGVLLGLTHGVLWGLIMFAGLTYIVDVENTGVVIRDNVLVRTVGPGIHYKIPFYEHVKSYPTGAIHSLESEPHKVLFKTVKTRTVSSTLLWKICDLELMHNKFGSFDESYIKSRLAQMVKDKVRQYAGRSNNFLELRNSSFLIEKDLVQPFSELGACITSFKISQKNDPNLHAK